MAWAWGSAVGEDRQSVFGAPANLVDWPRQGSNPGPTSFEAKKLSRPVSREPTPLISGAMPDLIVLFLPCQVVGDVTPTLCAPPSKGRPLAPAEAYPAALGVRRQGENFCRFQAPCSPTVKLPSDAVKTFLNLVSDSRSPAATKNRHEVIKSLN